MAGCHFDGRPLMDSFNFIPGSEQYSAWSDKASDDTLSLEEHVDNIFWAKAQNRRGASSQMSMSPSKFLAVEASTVLSSVHTIPILGETIELIPLHHIIFIRLHTMD
ncbi:myb-related protein A-like isoform X1 [Nerophis lumbriciformis]|uniref:myb-related protein A-like isoform X1 n=1 Tax=Nerophis lumbriciformis TaxID=546530 RepID=UPI003BABE877